MTRKRYSQRRGHATGSSKCFGQLVAIGDPCSLGKTIEVLNQHEDLDGDAYFAISTALHLKRIGGVYGDAKALEEELDGNSC